MLTAVEGMQEFDQSFPFFFRNPFQARGKPQKARAWRRCCFSKGTRKQRSLVLGTLGARGSVGKPVSAASSPRGKRLGKLLGKERGPSLFRGAVTALCAEWCSFEQGVIPGDLQRSLPSLNYSVGQ